ncbi:hypothetical protein H4582DRAFT_2041536 [Lactarius indigo]|nr:hypothetical protein H4582DRAFT_2041536 [Lactarius indigo]
MTLQLARTWAATLWILRHSLWGSDSQFVSTFGCAVLRDWDVEFKCSKLNKRIALSDSARHMQLKLEPYPIMGVGVSLYRDRSGNRTLA